MKKERLISFFRIPESPNRSRVLLLSLSIGALYICTLVGLFYAWYQVDTTVPFHWFDDSRGWLFVDKFGHFYTTFIECSILLSIWRWTGISKQSCLIIAALIAMVAQSSYEIFDGISPGYGASYHDILANLAGTFAFLVQHLVIKRVVLFSKFSFHPTAFAHLRPAFFGDTLIQQILKDYNGQTYWFTLDINGLFNKNILPKWLFITIGYGGNGMLGGDDNVWTDKSGVTKDFSHIARSSRIMLSFDFNWALITNSLLKKAAYIFTFVKFPAPTVEYDFVKGWRFYWIYF